MSTELNRIFKKIAALENRMAATSHQGRVHEVKGDKIRVELFDKGANGEPFLSPWIDTSDHRGGSRERKFYKKGQNVTVSTVNGQINEASTVNADAPNKTFKAPDHADDHKEGETYQLGELHKTNVKDLYENFLAEEDQQDQSQQQGQAGDGGQQQQGQSKKKPPSHMQRMHKEKGFTTRIGNDDEAPRAAVHKDGVKLRFKNDFFYINKDGIFASKEIQIAPRDPIPNDNDY